MGCYCNAVEGAIAVLYALPSKLNNRVVEIYIPYPNPGWERNDKIVYQQDSTTIKGRIIRIWTKTLYTDGVKNPHYVLDVEYENFQRDLIKVSKLGGIVFSPEVSFDYLQDDEIDAARSGDILGQDQIETIPDDVAKGLPVNERSDVTPNDQEVSNTDLVTDKPIEAGIINSKNILIFGLAGLVFVWLANQK